MSLFACVQPPPPPLKKTHVSAGRMATPRIDTCSPAPDSATLLPQSSFCNGDSPRPDQGPRNIAQALSFSPPGGPQRQHFAKVSPGFLVAPAAQQDSDSLAHNSMQGCRSPPRSVTTRYGAATRPALEHPRSRFSDGDTCGIRGTGGGCMLLGSTGFPAAACSRGSRASPPRVPLTAPGAWDVGSLTGGISAENASPAFARSLSCLDPLFSRRPDSIRSYHQPTFGGGNEYVSTGFCRGAAGPRFPAATFAHGQAAASEMPAAAQLGASLPSNAPDWLLPGSPPWGRATTSAAMPMQRNAALL